MLILFLHLVGMVCGDIKLNGFHNWRKLKFLLKLFTIVERNSFGKLALSFVLAGPKFNLNYILYIHMYSFIQ